jgi:diketogulonate reductase-like aldo/keto reductase
MRCADGAGRCQFTLEFSFVSLKSTCEFSPASQERNADNQNNAAGTSMMVAAHSASAILKAGKPYLVYGTAWKESRTSELVTEAIRAGFRFIDTACQPKHYNEAGVGEGWKAAADELKLQRSDLFLQTKYTPFPGQDPNRLPYDPHDTLEDQVKTSLQVSLRNLQTTYIDSFVLHSPLSTLEDTLTVWRTMESFVDDGTVHQLGISNCYDFDFFESLYQEARIKPKVLQNRYVNVKQGII